MIDMKYFVDTSMVETSKVGILNDEESPLIDSDGETNEHRKNKDPYKHYDKIVPEACGSLDSQQYMICDDRVWAFVLQTRTIGISSYKS